MPEREVIGDCAKLEFKGEGHEFEDLKVPLLMEWKREWAKHMEGWAFDAWNHTHKVLMAAYKRWFREIFPYEEPSEHQAWDDAEILLPGQLRGFDLEVPLSSGEEGDRSVRDAISAEPARQEPDCNPREELHKSAALDIIFLQLCLLERLTRLRLWYKKSTSQAHLEVASFAVLFTMFV